MAVPDYLSKPTHCHPPKKSPSQIDRSGSATEKKNALDLPPLRLESDGLPPPLETPFSHRWAPNWVWPCLIFCRFDTYGLRVGGVCACVWHYSSFKYRILDCLTGSNFIMPLSQTGGDKSQRRASRNLSRLRDKTRLRRLSFSTKLGRTKEVLDMKAGVVFFLCVFFLKAEVWALRRHCLQIFSAWSAVTQFSNCEINSEAHRASSDYYNFHSTKRYHT